MVTLLVSILLFGILIGIHEFGHLIAAKLNKINVIEFSIGMGPKIFSFNKGGTLYSLRLLPIGGFCNMEGEDEDIESQGSFSSKPPIRKISVLAAGAIMNLILGFVALFIIISASPTVDSTYIDEVNISSHAYQQDLKSGDKIIQIDNKRIRTFNDILYFMSDNNGESLKVTVLRDNVKKTINVKPYYNDGQYYIGITTKEIDNNIFESLKLSFYNEIFIGKLILKSLWQLICGDISLNEASGPVGVVKEIGNAAQNGFIDVMYILALITINLGLFNLLPIPALDGGRIFFSLIELISRRKIPVKIEATINALGLTLLMFVMLFVTFNDVIKLFI